MKESLFIGFLFSLLIVVNLSAQGSTIRTGQGVFETQPRPKKGFSGLGNTPAPQPKVMPKTVADCQREAVEKYPALGQKGSDFHEKCLALYNDAKQNNPTLLADPNWPMIIADKVSAAQPKSKEQLLDEVKKYRVIGYVYQVTEDGLILQGLNKGGDSEANLFYKHMKADRDAGITYAEKGLYIFLKGHPDQEKFADSDVVDVVAHETGVYKHGGTTYHAFTFYNK